MNYLGHCGKKTNRFVFIQFLQYKKSTPVHSGNNNEISGKHLGRFESKRPDRFKALDYVKLYIYEKKKNKFEPGIPSILLSKTPGILTRAKCIRYQINKWKEIRIQIGVHYRFRFIPEMAIEFPEKFRDD